MKRILMLCLACLAVAGCESTKVSSGKASAGEVYAFARPGAPDDARIVFTQDSTVISCFGAGMQVYLDEKLAAETGNGESVILYHKPGPTQLSIKNKAACAGGDLMGLLLDLKPGYSYQVRGYRGTWDKAEPLLTSPEPFQYKK